MKSTRFVLFASAFVLVLAGFTTTPWADGEALVGEWSYVVTGTPQGDGGGSVTFEMTDGALGGAIYSDLLYQTVKIQDAQVEGDSVFFKATFEADGGAIPTETRAKVDGDSMTGMLMTTAFGNFPFEASRKTETDSN